jgi:hypothetical protein
MRHIKRTINLVARAQNVGLVKVSMSPVTVDLMSRHYTYAIWELISREKWNRKGHEHCREDIPAEVKDQITETLLAIDNQIKEKGDD